MRANQKLLKKELKKLQNSNIDFIARHWYASVYEQFENYTHDVEFFIKVLNEQSCGKLNILEAACGGGRISVPLAQAGHTVTGFDADEHMLLRCYRRMAGLKNIRCYRADAAFSDWGNGYDAVVLAGNILINIESEMDYEKSQMTFIKKAAEALRTGGHLLMDYDYHSDESAMKTFNNLGERFYFEGTDELGTTGRTVSLGGAYDPVMRIWTGIGHWELTLNNGEKIIYAAKPRYKHIPSLKQVRGWLSDAGLAVEKIYKNYTDEQLSENETEYARATVWAAKK